MNLNVKSAEAHRLARALADARGISITRAVTDAIRHDLARMGAPKADVDAILALGRDTARRIPRMLRDQDYDDQLYDEAGLPR